MDFDKLVHHANVILILVSIVLIYLFLIITGVVILMSILLDNP